MSHARRFAGLIQDLPQTGAALIFAKRVHAGQVRKVDGAPFVRHPIEVAELLYDAEAPDHLIAAGLLHDVVEKTEVTAADLSEAFGPQISHLVLVVSEDETITDYGKRKALLRRQVGHAGDEALLLFAADKVSKLRELRAEYFRPETPRGRRVTHYRRCLQMLQQRLPDEWLVAQMRIEFEALPGEAPAPAPGAYKSVRPPSTARVSPVT